MDERKRETSRSARYQEILGVIKELLTEYQGTQESDFRDLEKAIFDELDSQDMNPSNLTPEQSKEISDVLRAKENQLFPDQARQRDERVKRREQLNKKKEINRKIAEIRSQLEADVEICERLKGEWMKLMAQVRKEGLGSDILERMDKLYTQILSLEDKARKAAIKVREQDEPVTTPLPVEEVRPEEPALVSGPEPVIEKAKTTDGPEKKNETIEESPAPSPVESVRQTGEEKKEEKEDPEVKLKEIVENLQRAGIEGRFASGNLDKIYSLLFSATELGLATEKLQEALKKIGLKNGELFFQLELHFGALVEGKFQPGPQVQELRTRLGLEKTEWVVDYRWSGPSGLVGLFRKANNYNGEELKLDRLQALYQEEAGKEFTPQDYENCVREALSGGYASPIVYDQQFSSDYKEVTIKNLKTQLENFKKSEPQILERMIQERSIIPPEMLAAAYQVEMTREIPDSVQLEYLRDLGEMFSIPPTVWEKSGGKLGDQGWEELKAKYPDLLDTKEWEAKKDGVFRIHSGLMTHLATEIVGRGGSITELQQRVAESLRFLPQFVKGGGTIGYMTREDLRKILGVRLDDRTGEISLSKPKENGQVPDLASPVLPSGKEFSGARSLNPEPIIPPPPLPEPLPSKKTSGNTDWGFDLHTDEVVLRSPLVRRAAPPPLPNEGETSTSRVFRSPPPPSLEPPEPPELPSRSRVIEPIRGDEEITSEPLAGEHRGGEEAKKEAKEGTKVLELEGKELQYFGELVNGEMQGKGRLKGDGTSITGEFRDDKLWKGKGTLSFEGENNTVYNATGDFEQYEQDKLPQLSGNGRMEWEDRGLVNWLEGEFVSGDFQHGRGGGSRKSKKTPKFSGQSFGGVTTWFEEGEMSSVSKGGIVLDGQGERRIGGKKMQGEFHQGNFISGLVENWPVGRTITLKQKIYSGEVKSFDGGETIIPDGVGKLAGEEVSSVWEKGKRKTFLSGQPEIAKAAKMPFSRLPLRNSIIESAGNFDLERAEFSSSDGQSVGLTSRRLGVPLLRFQDRQMIVFYNPENEADISVGDKDSGLAITVKMKVDGHDFQFTSDEMKQLKEKQERARLKTQHPGWADHQIDDEIFRHPSSVSLIEILKKVNEQFSGRAVPQREEEEESSESRRPVLSRERDMDPEVKSDQERYQELLGRCNQKREQALKELKKKIRKEKIRNNIETAAIIAAIIAALSVAGYFGKKKLQDYLDNLESQRSEEKAPAIPESAGAEEDEELVLPDPGSLPRSQNRTTVNIDFTQGQLGENRGFDYEDGDVEEIVEEEQDESASPIKKKKERGDKQTTDRKKIKEKKGGGTAGVEEQAGQDSSQTAEGVERRQSPAQPVTETMITSDEVKLTDESYEMIQKRRVEAQKEKVKKVEGWNREQKRVIANYIQVLHWREHALGRAGQNFSSLVEQAGISSSYLEHPLGKQWQEKTEAALKAKQDAAQVVMVEIEKADADKSFEALEAKLRACLFGTEAQRLGQDFYQMEFTDNEKFRQIYLDQVLLPALLWDFQRGPTRDRIDMDNIRAQK